MKVTLLVAKNNGHFTIPAGATVDVTETEGAALIEANEAVAADPYAMCVLDSAGYLGCLSPQQQGRTPQPPSNALQTGLPHNVEKKKLN